MLMSSNFTLLHVPKLSPITIILVTVIMAEQAVLNPIKVASSGSTMQYPYANIDEVDSSPYPKIGRGVLPLSIIVWQTKNMH